MEKTDFAIIGAGLAGCECALALAAHGYSSTIFEQKPAFRSAAHASGEPAELVCSNSFRSTDPESGIGLLKMEMTALGSAFMEAALACRVPAGKALAVDREAFSAHMARRLKESGYVRLVERRIESIADPCLAEAGPAGVIVAAGPMASEALSSSLREIVGGNLFYFYDAIAPIIWTASLDMSVVFRASRYDGESAGDYLNSPMTREEYMAFHQALLEGKTFTANEFEKEKHFEGCMPIEALAARGEKTLAFGPMKPVGLTDPRTQKRPWAVLQLRPEKANMETCNLVGCQTKLLQGEQERIFRMAPGLEHVEFARYGSMHRNTYVDAPRALNPDLSLINMPGVYLAGQITGVEGYVESAASGLWLGHYLACKAEGKTLTVPPRETALGALLGHLRMAVKKFQPSNAHFGLMPELEGKPRKKERKAMYALRAREAFMEWKRNNFPEQAINILLEP